MSPENFDTRQLRDALGRYATGVAIVTARDGGGQPVGLTINSFASVSLAPPLVLWSLGLQSRYLDAFTQASHHAIHILAASQQEWSNRFASPNGERFAGIDWQSGLGGAPLLPGTIVTLEVANTSSQIAGDHHLFIGQVARLSGIEAQAPLLYHAGGYAGLAGA